MVQNEVLPQMVHSARSVYKSVEEWKEQKQKKKALKLEAALKKSQTKVKKKAGSPNHAGKEEVSFKIDLKKKEKRLPDETELDEVMSPPKKVKKSKTLILANGNTSNLQCQTNEQPDDANSMMSPPKKVKKVKKSKTLILANGSTSNLQCQTNEQPDDANSIEEDEVMSPPQKVKKSKTPILANGNTMEQSDDANNIEDEELEVKNVNSQSKLTQSEHKKKKILKKKVGGENDPRLMKMMNGSSWKCMQDSQRRGFKTLKWLISPVSTGIFFNDYWEKKELLIKAEHAEKFDGILSCNIIDNILRRNRLEFTKNIDVTSYTDGKRQTLNPEGRALPSIVWDFYNDGCSVRLLNPQTFHRPVRKLLATLQEYFQSFCGANVYLTPPGTQGFAPHWDDIEAFILQLEGKKRWRVYRPRNPKETLPRESSGNFGPDDDLGKPCLDCVLEPGDLLYFPRGFIHQGEALDDVHSLHITISTYQKNSWVDLLEKLLPAALSEAAEEDVEFRRGLPIGYFNDLGIANANKKNDVQKGIAQKVSDLVTKMMNYAPINAAVDQMAKGFVHDSLPPVLLDTEANCSVFEGAERWSDVDKNVVNKVQLKPNSLIKLMRRHCVRLVVEEKSVRLFYSVDNSLEYHAEEPKYLEVEPTMAPAIEALIHAYPEYKSIEDLPLQTLENKMSLAIGLWERGIIATDSQLYDRKED